MSIGNRVFLKRPMPSQELLEGFVGLPAANIADTMGRSCAMNPRIRLMSGFQGIMAGPALTVKARAGDNLFLHQALEMTRIPPAPSWGRSCSPMPSIRRSWAGW